MYRYLYSYLLTGEENIELKRSVYAEHKLNDKDVAFADTLICDILSNETEISDSISEISIGYSLERINYLDRAALMLAMAELKSTDTDVAVIVDEAMRLVKKYSLETSLPFVNGILAEYAKKAGR